MPARKYPILGPGIVCVKQLRPRGYWRGGPCGSPAVVMRDDKPYCLRHDPVRIAQARRERSAEAWREFAEKRAREVREWQQEMERERKRLCA